MAETWVLGVVGRSYTQAHGAATRVSRRMAKPQTCELAAVRSYARNLEHVRRIRAKVHLDLPHTRHTPRKTCGSHTGAVCVRPAARQWCAHLITTNAQRECTYFVGQMLWRLG